MPWMLVVEAEEVEEDEDEEGEEVENVASDRSEPKQKKRKVVVNRRGRKEKRQFLQQWKKGREWLQYSESQGMWCSICYP